jgi:hypothetical protein
MDDDREALSWQAQRRAVEGWVTLGLRSQYARALTLAGYLTLDDLRKATDFDLGVLIGVGKKGRQQILHLLGREAVSPSNPKSRDHFERTWRFRIGDERFERLLDDLVDMAGTDLDKVNQSASRALWALVRRRRNAVSSLAAAPAD